MEGFFETQATNYSKSAQLTELPKFGCSKLKKQHSTVSLKQNTQWDVSASKIICSSWQIISFVFSSLGNFCENSTFKKILGSVTHQPNQTAVCNSLWKFHLKKLATNLISCLTTFHLCFLHFKEQWWSQKYTNKTSKMAREAKVSLTLSHVACCRFSP